MKILTAALVAVAVLGAAPSQPRLDDFEELRDYSSWQEVTSGPHQVPLQAAADCMAPQLPHPGAVELPDRDRYVRVFASSQAAPLMRAPRVESYPVGSVVAKVKLVEGFSEPTGVAFMVKGKPGSNPEGRDWEYFVFEGQPLRLAARGAVASCQRCHGEMTYTDGLYRSYLSDGTGAAQDQ
jgi:hypothetical protein